MSNPKIEDIEVGTELEGSDDYQDIAALDAGFAVTLKCGTVFVKKKNPLTGEESEMFLSVEEVEALASLVTPSEVNVFLDDGNGGVLKDDSEDSDDGSVTITFE